MKKKFVVFLIICACPWIIYAQSYTKQVAEFDQFVQKGMKDWDVPGLAVAVVKDNKIIYKKGLGVREIGKPDRIDTQTLFSCASTTKAMLATCMGMLVDEGKIKWDDQVVNYLPEFRLYDPYVTRELRVRDLFTHSSGVGNTDFLWGWMVIPSDEVLKKMALVKPSYSLRSSFIYQNIFYLAAGKVIEKVSGKPWSEFMRQRIFATLGMTRTVPLQKETRTMTNVTSPHYRIEGKTEIVQHTSADDIGPAGSVWSCIDDMATWAMCMLDSSKYSGGRLLQASTWNELFTPQVIVPDEQFYPSMQLTKPNWKTYGLGWFQHDYKGYKVNFHTGSLAGAIAIHGQLPAHKLGIYVFGNQDHAEIRHALMYKAFDLFALGGNRDWNADLIAVYKNIHAKNKIEEDKHESNRQTGTTSSVPVEKFTGKYRDELYGEVVVERDGDGLLITVNQNGKARLKHWHFNTYEGWYDKKWWGKMSATFGLNAEGEVEGVTIDGMELKKVNE